MARRRWKKIAGTTILVIIALVVLGITFTIGWRPFIGAKKRALTDRKFEATPARLARGRYLVDGVRGCFGCHTDQDWSKPGAPPVAGRDPQRDHPRTAGAQRAVRRVPRAHRNTA